ncbi:MAG: ATP-binding protein [Gemmatimonadota bacterium]
MLLIIAALLGLAYREVERVSAATVSERLQTLSTQIETSLRSSSAASEHGARRLASLPEAHQYFRSPSSAAAGVLFAAIARIDGDDSTAAAVALLDVDGRPLAISGRMHASIASLPLPVLASRLAASPDSAAVGPLQVVGGKTVFPVIAVVTEGGREIGRLVRWRVVVPRPSARAQIGALFGGGSALLLGTPGGAWTDQVEVVPQPELPMVATTAAIRYTTAAGRGHLAAVAYDSISGWFSVLEVPDSVVEAPARNFATRIGMIGLALSLLATVLVWWFGYRISIPIHRLTAVADAMGAGRERVRAAVTGDDEVGRLALTFNRMADRMEAGAAARQASERQWRLLFTHNPVPMWVFEPTSLRFLAVNDAAVKQYGYSRAEFRQLTLRDIRPPEHVGILLETVADGLRENHTVRQFRHRRKDGTFFDVELTGNNVEFNGTPARFVIAQDITVRQALESQLRQSQKMEAVGRLAGGVAHDFNNLLAVIIAYTELVRFDTPDDDPHAADLDEVKAAGERASALTRQLLTFSRRDVVLPAVVDPNGAVAAVDKLLRRLIGEDIHVVAELAPEPGAIHVDPGQFEQVLINLAVNARDAMPTGGTLTIRTEQVTVDEASRELHGLPEAGRFVVISVNDTGVGMTPDVRSHIFEPFFTTKEVGKGTGLGLATVYAIVTQAGGSVSVYSELGTGSTFRLYFPVVAAPDAVAAITSGQHPVVGGHETILLVEDDAAVRAAAVNVLQRLGYTVLGAEGADDAAAIVARHAGVIDLVISDVVMPGTDGPTLLHHLRNERPGIKTLLMSGYTGDAITRRGVMESGVPFLQKPFTVGRLGRMVREVLDG